MFSMGVSALGKRSFWLVGPANDMETCSNKLMGQFATAAASAVAQAISLVSADMNAQSAARSAVQSALLSRDGVSEGVRIVRPETLAELDYCRWNGDGHYNVSEIVGLSPPSLGQIVKYLDIMRKAEEDNLVTIHLSSQEHAAVGAVLAGARLVLMRGMPSKQAWQEILKAYPAPSANPSKAWDRFPLPFSRDGATCSSSVTVLDCLEALEVATQLGWFDHRSFNVPLWKLLREKFDATWLVPGEILALGHPDITARNPNFPGLLNSSEQKEPAKNVVTSIADVSDNESEDELIIAEDEAPSPPWPSPPTPRFFQNRLNPRATLDPRAKFLPCKNALKNSMDDVLCPISSDNFTSSEEDLLKADCFRSFFERMQLRCIVRLNRETEFEHTHSNAAISVLSSQIHATEFNDGEVPPPEVVRAFLSVCSAYRTQCASDGVPGRLAVHCVAGLGRTGLMVGIYAAHRHKVRGSVFHGWTRMCRPGTVQTTEQEKYLRRLVPDEGSNGKTAPRFLNSFGLNSFGRRPIVSVKKIFSP
mmetsp:Transcript_51288/g.111318  ORF Transcript_51288/g.111318 Transcript_51288/m.111318 type:complete len:533 (+) Transcript_51288:53-1651(+)